MGTQRSIRAPYNSRCSFGCMIEHMLDNFAYLIKNYGHIPNGNRSYYLSRSQPPFFALMVQLLANEKGDSIYIKYADALEKEYAWWMDGSDRLQNAQSYRRVVKMPDGSVLNRYYDDKRTPREESYVQDVNTAKAHGYGREWKQKQHQNF